MTAYVDLPSYLRPRTALNPRRAVVLASIALLHVAALAAAFLVRGEVSPEVTELQPMMVSFISEMPPEPLIEPPPPPPPPKPVKPEPKPKMIAAVTPEPAAIQAPPIEEELAEEAPVEPVPPAPAAPAPVIPPNFVAAYLNNPGPKYPQASIRLREQGTVLLLVLVGVDGRAEKVTVDHSSGYARLDASAVDVVRTRWRFVAAKQGDQAVAAWVKVPISFELKQHH